MQWSETRKEIFLSDDEGNPIKHILWKTPEGIVLKIPVRLNELEVVEGEIWANMWPTETVVRIEMETGKLLGWVDMSECYLEGSLKRGCYVVPSLNHQLVEKGLMVESVIQARAVCERCTPSSALTSLLASAMHTRL